MYARKFYNLNIGYTLTDDNLHRVGRAKRTFIKLEAAAQ